MADDERLLLYKTIKELKTEISVNAEAINKNNVYKKQLENQAKKLNKEIEQLGKEKIIQTKKLNLIKEDVKAEIKKNEETKVLENKEDRERGQSLDKRKAELDSQARDQEFFDQMMENGDKNISKQIKIVKEQEEVNKKIKKQLYRDTVDLSDERDKFNVLKADIKELKADLSNKIGRADKLAYDVEKDKRELKNQIKLYLNKTENLKSTELKQIKVADKLAEEKKENIKELERIETNEKVQEAIIEEAKEAMDGLTEERAVIASERYALKQKEDNLKERELRVSVSIKRHNLEDLMKEADEK